ncbi:unnamed protein product, partial [marine sediment metagenome]
MEIMHAIKKKLTLLKIVPRGISGANALITYMLTPTGGVIAPIVVIIVKIIAYHIGSKPRAIPSGKKIGIVSTRNPKESIKQPPIKYINNTIAKMTKGDTGSEAAKFATINGSLVTARKRPKIMAPVTRTKTMHDIFKVSVKELISPFQVSLRVAIVTINVQKTPTASASVGVNKPTNKPPITRINIAIASTTPVRDFIFSLRLVFGPGGPNSGLNRQTTSMVSTNKIPKTMAGKMPARKSL